MQILKLDKMQQIKRFKPATSKSPFESLKNSGNIEEK